MQILNAKRQASSAESEMVDAAVELAGRTDLDNNPGPYALGVFEAGDSSGPTNGNGLKPDPDNGLDL